MCTCWLNRLGSYLSTGRLYSKSSCTTLISIRIGLQWYALWHIQKIVLYFFNRANWIAAKWQLYSVPNEKRDRRKSWQVGASWTVHCKGYTIATATVLSATGFPRALMVTDKPQTELYWQLTSPKIAYIGSNTTAVTTYRLCPAPLGCLKLLLAALLDT